MKKVLACAIGECVHVAGVCNFLRLAEIAGWETTFLGPATPIEEIISAAESMDPDMIGVSYRLTPDNGENLILEFISRAAHLKEKEIIFAFGGTPPVAARVKKMNFFDLIYDGSEFSEDILSYLKGSKIDTKDVRYPQETIPRRLWKAPFPLLRHHFGLPSIGETESGIRKIAEAKVLDVISLGTDQDAQENFFHPNRQNPRKFGAGGVPVRSEEDLKRLFDASRTGNYPLMRSYSGTDDFVRMAEILTKNIENAWCAVPLFWFNRMDGRGPWDLESSILEHQRLMAWYSEQGIPVELNEPHHWGMRDAPDVVFVVSAYLSAYNAKKFGVKDYIAQLMFNSPPDLSDTMDLAKMQAIVDIIAPLSGPEFRIWYETRTGLLSYPLEINAARAHLASSVYLQVALKPDIVHIVGHTEADHAATAEEVIEAALMARRSIENALKGQPDMNDDTVLKRKKHLIDEAYITLDCIRSLSFKDSIDPLTDPGVLAHAVKIGILDAPHLKNNPYASGKVKTRIINGACEAIGETGLPMSEKDRLKLLILKSKARM